MKKFEKLMSGRKLLRQQMELLAEASEHGGALTDRASLSREMVRLHRELWVPVFCVAEVMILDFLIYAIVFIKKFGRR